MSAGLIDIHTHVTPRTLPGADPGVSGWPCMQCDAGRTTMMLGAKPFRDLDGRSWDVGRRIADMDIDGVDIQLLSPMPELLSYWFPGDDAERMADHVNAQIAEMVARDPLRFRGLGMLPLQDVSKAVPYLQRLKARFGLIGIEIGSNINGRLPGDPMFGPIYEVADQEQLAIFVHALHPVATRTVELGPDFGPVVGFPLDVGMAGASLILSGMVERFPRLRIALSHGGGSMATLAGRMEQGWSNLAGLKGRLTQSPTAQVRRLFYDSNVYDPALLKYLATEMAPGQLCVGTDYPYLIMQADPAAYIEASRLDATVLPSIHRTAALRFMGEYDEPQAGPE